MYPLVDFAFEARYRRRAFAGRTVTGGPPLSGALSLYPFGIKESPNGTSLAMYPLVDFALQAQGYVSKGRSFLSDAPFGRFSIPHPRVRQEGTALA